MLFPVTIATPFTNVTYRVPDGTMRQLVTGLSPNTGYSVSIASIDYDIQVQITPGGMMFADNGGVLSIGVPSARPIWIPLVRR